jgi:hypothetical protein
VTKIYTNDDGTCGLQINVTRETLDQYMAGTRTLVHLPAEWSPFTDAPRELAPGDEIGLLVAPHPRVRMTEILRVEKVRLHDLSPTDLVALGRKSTDLALYHEAWDRLWSHGSAPEEDGAWPWASNPEVYAIYWKPIKETGQQEEKKEGRV